jgi:hypothetical protein
MNLDGFYLNVGLTSRQMLSIGYIVGNEIQLRA